MGLGLPLKIPEIFFDMAHLSSSNVLTVPRLWNLVAETYSYEIAPFHAQYAQDALHFTEVGPDMLIADVACGPGDLSLAAARCGTRVTGCFPSIVGLVPIWRACKTEGE